MDLLAVETYFKLIIFFMDCESRASVLCSLRDAEGTRGEIVSRFIVNASHCLQHESHLVFFFVIKLFGALIIMSSLFHCSGFKKISFY